MSKQAVKKTTKSKTLRAVAAKPESQMSRREMIAREAYLFAEKRGFQGGDSVADWLEAETKVDSILNSSH